jgi:hypothetical protein
MEEFFSVSHPFVTVQEAAFLCDVSQTTIRTKIKEYKMKTYLDDKGHIHIRTLDLLLYYHKRMTGQIAKAEKDLHKAINARNKVLSEYYALFREYDDRLNDNGEGCITISALRDKLDELHNSCIELKKVLITIGKQTNYYYTVK